jgi:threonine dehydrogenase-like Zn-dependent dehydrogenase
MMKAALVEPLAVGVHSVRITWLAPRESLILFGADTIGLWTLVAARAMGIKEIVITDISEVKLKIGQRVGLPMF